MFGDRLAMATIHRSAKFDRVTNCWVWRLRKTPDGYGRLTFRRQPGQSAHRISYAAFVGDLIPGQTIDHLCRNPSCVNPGHLEQVSNATNILRGVSFSAKNIKKTHCDHGHPLSGTNVSLLRRCNACNSVARKKYRAKRKGRSV